LAKISPTFFDLHTSKYIRTYLLISLVTGRKYFNFEMQLAHTWKIQRNVPKTRNAMKR